MKKHSSVLMLVTRSTIYRVLGLLIVMAAAEAGLFWLRLQQGAIDGNFSLEAVISESRLTWACAAIFLFVTAVLSWGSSTVSGAYTSARLSIPSKMVFLWQCVYNILCYLIFWMVQILVMIALCRVYEAQAPAEFVSNQTVFLAFYRSDFLHSILPFEDTWCWVRNLALVMALGICASRCPGKQSGKFRFHDILAIATVFFFVREIGAAGNYIFMLLLSMLCAGIAVGNVLKKDSAEGVVEGGGSV